METVFKSPSGKPLYFHNKKKAINITKVVIKQESILWGLLKFSRPVEETVQVMCKEYSECSRTGEHEFIGTKKYYRYLINGVWYWRHESHIIDGVEYKSTWRSIRDQFGYVTWKQINENIAKLGKQGWFATN